MAIMAADPRSCDKLARTVVVIGVSGAGPLFGERVLRADMAWTAVAVAVVSAVVLGAGGTG